MTHISRQRRIEGGLVVHDSRHWTMVCSVTSMAQSDEALTRQAYDLVADVYADHFTATEPEQAVDLAMVAHFAALVDGARRILDAGCGAGRMLPVLAGLGCSPTGVDLSSQMIRRANLDHPDFPASVGNLTSLAFPEDSFDGVFSWYSTIHGTDDDLERMVSEMARVLRPGGHVLLAFQVGKGRRRVGEGYAKRGLDVVMHRHHRTREQVISVLGRHGLKVVAELERGAMGSERDPQAVVIARHPEHQEGSHAG